MSRARGLLILAALLFFGWIAWLGYAVYVARYAPEPVIVVSRAQITAATHLIVADVNLNEEGLPAPTVKVVEVLRGDGLSAGEEANILNLGSALPPGANGFPGPGRYLIPSIGDGKTFRVAGLPRSPGYEPSNPARPAIYPWSEDTRAQLRGLGLMEIGK